MIYKMLSKYKKKNNIYQTDEYRYYAKNAMMYSSILSYYKFTTTETQPFRIIAANIIIKAIKNKELIEHNLELFSLESTQEINVDEDSYVRNKVWALLDENNAPYFSVEKSRIYIPIYSRTLNIIYNDECSKLLEFPYNKLLESPKTSCVDLFDTYQIDLFASPFTSLILIKKDKTSAAFYHADFDTIFIINDQGRLDLEIPLYDKFMKNFDRHKVINKIEAVVDLFYANDYFGFAKGLYQNHLISKKLYNNVRNKMIMNLIWKDKIFSKGKESYEVL